MSSSTLVDDIESFSFEDAQRNPHLLNPTEGEAGDALAHHVARKDTHQSSGERHGETHLGTETLRIDQQEEYESMAKDFQIETEAERNRAEQLDQELQAEKQRKRRAEREELRQKEKLRREEETRRMQIQQAVSIRRRIQGMQKTIKEDEIICAGWSNGKSGEEALGRQIHGFWMTRRPTTKQMAERKALIEDVEKILEKKWPGCGLHLMPFGSTQTGLFEASSDIDLTLIDPMRPYGVGTGAIHSHLSDIISIAAYGLEKLPDYYSVRSIGTQLKRHGEGHFRQIVPIPKAKVPIVKFVYGRSGLCSDINVNDAFGNVNSELIRAYIDIHPEIIQPYLFAIKKWASRRGINDPSGKSGPPSLNSYTICMIAIQYLQIQGIVPNLQNPDLLALMNTQRTYLWQKPSPHPEKPAKAFVRSDSSTGGYEIDPLTGARRFETTFAKGRDVKDREEFFAALHKTQPSTTPLQRISKGPIFEKMGELLKGFFAWLSNFDFAECGISIRLGTPFRRFEKVAKEAYAHLPHVAAPINDWRGDKAIVVQDPFILDRNTANITKQMRETIVDESWRAIALLEEERMSSSTILVDLIHSFEHEQMIRKHEIAMKAFDDETRNLVIREASENRPGKERVSR
ncbi:hypothetical protein CBS101457_006399 [Exobasidium rhododendri]|nr:hypothetical protein CBS101457_006399 [Exobasidium rhododendri]